MAKTDRRVQRTRRAIHESLLGLMLEMQYDEITVQHILDRANVGRSTFYTHYRDKDEILIASVDELHTMLAGAHDAAKSNRQKAEDVIAFSRAMFEHAAEYRKVYRALVAARVWPRVRQGIQDVLADLIRGDVKKLRTEKSPIPLDLLVHHLAATFMSVLAWTLENRSSIAPSEADALYRALVLPTLRTAL
ncbi:MAG TPA: TetR/AcrR family transcriptional regulator [Thermoanaerobaculia bacterium]